MGGKGSRRPEGSDKPLSEVFAGLQEDIWDMYERLRAIEMKINYHAQKHKKIEEYRRRMRRLRERK